MQSYERVGAAKRASLLSAIPKQWIIPASKLPGPDVLDVSDYPRTSGLMTEEELSITECGLVELADRIAAGLWSAKEITLAFCHRAALAHQLVNCCSEIFFDLAIASAEVLDENFRVNRKVVGPLHGIPVSLKDQFRVTGIETSVGYVAWLGKKETRDSVLVDLLRSAGAILYVKTSVPQTLMVGETFNNIIGRTLNPFNRMLSCGGSSGGEGALIGMRGSIIGVGTDIGGSIRIPAAFNHLCGLRPSHGRLPYALTANSMEGQEAIHSVCGPIGHSINDLAYFTQVVLGQEPWNHDPKVVDLPWRPETLRAGAAGPKTFAYMIFDGSVMPHPPVQRAMREVIDALRAKGHKLVPWKSYDHARGVSIIGRIFNADGHEEFRRVMQEGGEPPIPNTTLTNEPAATMTELWQLHIERYHYQREYLEHWNQQNHEHNHIDAIIMPIAPHAAVTHDNSLYYGYTSIINLLDYTSVCVPVGFADAQIDHIDKSYAPISELDKKNWSNYDPIKYHGAPTAVQIVGRRLQEEQVLGFAMQAEEALK